MRFLFADFDGVLGVQGEVVFPQDRPLVLYGENVSGKSNIINALRYCMNPPLGRRGSDYAEDKLPAKQEMLVDPLDEGSVTIYFVQGEELFKLEYRFTRSGSEVNRHEALYITEGEPPTEDISTTLRRVDWGSRNETGVTAIKDTLEEKEVYTEILDVLIAPSNIANFSEAVSGEIIDVPELIEEEIERRRKRSEWYEQRLTMLKNGCEKQDEQLSEELENLREAFLNHDFAAADLSQEEAAKQFDAGGDGLWSFKETVSERRGELPDVRQQVQALSQLVEQVQDQTEKIGAVWDALEDQEKVIEWVVEQPQFESAHDTVRRWEDKLEGLPSEENIESITEFSPLDTEDFDFDLLKNGEELEEYLDEITTIQEKIGEAQEIRKNHDIPKGRLDERKAELDRLIESLDDPVAEPDGVDSVLFVEGSSAAVGVPESEVDALQDEPSYTDVASTPQVVQTEEGSSASLDEYREEVENDRDDIELAIAARNDAKELVEKFKEEVPDRLAKERKSLKRKANYREQKIDDAKQKWNTAYANLCSEFDTLEEENLAFDDVAAVEQSVSRLQEAVSGAKATIRENLEGELSAFDDIEVPDEINEEAFDVLVETLEQKEVELQEAGEVLDDLETWIDQNLDDVETTVEKLDTARVAGGVAVIGALVFHEVKQKSDISEIVDQLADSIETNVRATYNHIFAGESLEFRHEGDGEFRCRLNGEEITHPSGSQRAVMSFGIMLSLAKSFDLPILLDEAADRFDYIRLASFYDFITGITADQGIQTCLVMCKSKDIEEHEEVREQMADSAIYRLKGVNEVENEVRSADLDAIIGSS
jgi:DNA repair exonuclease SbcCD ATPase subunit